jgi:hypothetical protein
VIRLDALTARKARRESPWNRSIPDRQSSRGLLRVSGAVFARKKVGFVSSRGWSAPRQPHVISPRLPPARGFGNEPKRQCGGARTSPVTPSCEVCRLLRLGREPSVLERDRKTRAHLRCAVEPVQGLQQVSKAEIEVMKRDSNLSQPKPAQVSGRARVRLIVRGPLMPACAPAAGTR